VSKRELGDEASLYCGGVRSNAKDSYNVQPRGAQVSGKQARRKINMSDGQKPLRPPVGAPYTPSFKDQSRSVVQPIAVVEEPAPADTNTNNNHADADEQVPIASAQLVTEEEQDDLQQTKFDAEGEPATSKSFNDVRSRTEATNTSFGIKSSITASTTVAGKSKRTKYYVAVGILFVSIAAIVGLVVALTNSDGGGNGKSSEDQQRAFFMQVGDNMDGTLPNTYLGTSLALSETGNRMAAASANDVRVFEFVDDEWQQIGQDIVVSNNTAITSRFFNLQDPALMSVAMDANGEYVVVGFGEGGFANQGMVQVYQYITSSNSWNLYGSAMFGLEAGDRFGTAVAMDAGGNRIAIGAPGQEGSLGSINVYQYDSIGEWGRLGNAIVGNNNTATVSELGRSVAISASGDRVAAGARSVPDGSSSQGPVVTAVYEYNRFGDLMWTAMGEGITGGSLTASTGWYVDLSDAGDIMVVSNAYLQEADFVNINPDDLVVKAYQWINGVWVNLGNKLHAGISGDKSGYVVSLSGDGLAIGMGDSGSSTGGRSRGHAHIYKFVDHDWEQVGPNIEGQSDGDNFGFSVALSGDGTRFATGAPYSRAGGRDAGRVQVRALEL